MKKQFNNITRQSNLSQKMQLIITTKGRHISELRIINKRKNVSIRQFNSIESRSYRLLGLLIVKRKWAIIKRLKKAMKGPTN